jgi:hypothetical protein
LRARRSRAKDGGSVIASPAKPGEAIPQCPNGGMEIASAPAGPRNDWLSGRPLWGLAMTGCQAGPFGASQ